ncbi:transglutaminaseTgpA domain-containing protein [Actinomadura sp. 6N118]|uniref:transglutaminase family protein n=1 Tax=Actinomadura sp. 6N118 TaxID=3375151 RepID=UPI0037B26314
MIGLLIRARPTVCVVLAAVVAGLLYAGVFEFSALLVPVCVPAAAVLATALAFSGRRLEPWRPLATVATGVIAVGATSLWTTTLFGLPTPRTLQAVAAGITDSWRLTLQFTWPARPEAPNLLFIPIMVVLAAVLGVELVHRLRGPLPALLPSLAIAISRQFYGPLEAEPGVAVLGSLAYAAAAASLLAAVRAGPATETSRAERQLGLALTRAVAPVILAVAAAVPAGLLPGARSEAYTLREEISAPVTNVQATSPLDDLAGRLTASSTPVFEVRGGGAGVTHWPLVVLDEYDGVNWTGTQDGFRRLGAGIPRSPLLTGPVKRRTARIEVVDTGGPWLPSQYPPAQVDGAAPLVDPERGTLLLPEGSAAGAEYLLTWWEPQQIDKDTFRNAGFDWTAPGGRDPLGEDVPDWVAPKAKEASGDKRATLETALTMEAYFRDNFTHVTSGELPTGHSWHNLKEFFDERRGTSEQFAAAYVVLARTRGIPARLAVGYKAPPASGGAYTVRGGDAGAWPEVAVKGVGWVPLNPAGTAEAAGAGGGGLAESTQKLRDELPPPEDLSEPPVRPDAPAGRRQNDGDAGLSVPWSLLLLLPPGLLLASWLFGVPAAKALRARRRRLRPGEGAVVGAWKEARDLLRAYGVPVSAGMTLRDLTTEAARTADPPTVTALDNLAVAVDVALWAGDIPGKQVNRQAWTAVRAVRLGLARQGSWPRLRAGLNPRPLLPLRTIHGEGFWRRNRRSPLHKSSP